MKIVPFELKYANGVSEAVCDSLLKVNINDYDDLEGLESMAQKHNPQTICIFASQRYMCVAVDDNDTVLGVASIYPLSNEPTTYYVATFFIHSKSIRQGIGKALFNNIHEFAKACGGKKFVVDASLSSPDFYEKMGFLYEAGKRISFNNDNYQMYREI